MWSSRRFPTSGSSGTCGATPRDDLHPDGSGEPVRLLHEYLVLYGERSGHRGWGPEVLQRLAHTYLGPDVTFPPMPDPPPATSRG